MRIRKLIAEHKILKSETQWSRTDLPPRHAPVYPKTLPIRGTWQWRSARAAAGETNFIMVALCNPPRNNWKAFLILETADGASIISRFEHHASHGGLHIHAHCDRGGIETGPTGFDNLARIPEANASHRRKNAWTEEAFWEAAKRFFRIREDEGPLFDHAR